MRTLLIIPAFNEAGAIRGVIDAARPHVDGDIVVDDGSRTTPRRWRAPPGRPRCCATRAAASAPP
ncbi:MAG: hypothetical protein U0802_08490 [Candidatus Binatia bacterium]